MNNIAYKKINNKTDNSEQKNDNSPNVMVNNMEDKMGRKTTFKKFGATALAVSIAIGGMSFSNYGSASAESLRDALASAYTSNPDLLAQRAALRATDEGVVRATSGFLPTLSANSQISRSRTDNDLIDLDPTRNSTDTYFYSARVDQSLFSGFQSINGRKEARSFVEAGRALLLSSEQQTLLNAVTAYMDVVRDEAVLRLTSNNVQVLARQLQASRDRFRVGEITRTDVAQSEARFEGSKAAQISSEANLASSRAVYRQVIGNTPGTLDQPPALPAMPADVDSAIEIAIEENPQIAVAYYNEKAAGHAISRNQGSLLPQIGAFASISRNEGIDRQILGLDDTNVSVVKTVGIQAQWQLYQGGAEYSDVRRAKQQRSQRRLEMVSADRQVRADVRSTYEQYRASVSTIQSNQTQVRANEIALEGVRQEAAVGSRTTLDVLDAEQELLDARVNLVRAERNRYVAGFQVLLTVGRLNAMALDLPVELYDPKEYYKDVRWKMVGWGTE
ncbi:MAG: TolC family outer membrane protein [Sphingomonadales bacterium]|nr:TolC family outer membrane protein [Sphingomonadales bacterium]